MSSETSMVAADFHLQELATQVRECQGRPTGMSVVSWYACHGITNTDYYYWLRRVRETCLETIHVETPARQMFSVPPGLLQQQEQNGHNTQPGLDISIKGSASM